MLKVSTTKLAESWAATNFVAQKKISQKRNVQCVIHLQSKNGYQETGTAVNIHLNCVQFEIFGAKKKSDFVKDIEDFKIIFMDDVLYSGKASLGFFIEQETKLYVEAKLDDQFWKRWYDDCKNVSKTFYSDIFSNFHSCWADSNNIDQQFKLAVYDMRSFLEEFKIWAEHLEVQLMLKGTRHSKLDEDKMIRSLLDPFTRQMDLLIERMENGYLSDTNADSNRYKLFLRNSLHSLVLCSPFAKRAFQKPLGYAGDYLMVSMMLANHLFEGGNLFSRIINAWFLNQTPAEAHRNRVVFLEKAIVSVAMSAKSKGKVARIYSMGCGPAGEIHNFITNHNLSNYVHFDLVDFNEETLNQLKQSLNNLAENTNKPIFFNPIKKSVHEFLKEGRRDKGKKAAIDYDFIYCAGLFDYLQDSVCSEMMDIFYEMLVPGGVLLATNATDQLNEKRPFRYSMELILDWHLIYRSPLDFLAFAPKAAPNDNVKTLAENVGANLFLEVIKPEPCLKA